MKFEEGKLTKIDFSKTTGGIPLPPGAYFRYPKKADTDQDENDPSTLIDKAQLLVEFGAQNGWKYRSLCGYIGSMKRLPEKSSNTSTSWLLTMVCKLPYKQQADPDVVIGSPYLFLFIFLASRMPT